MVCSIQTKVTYQTHTHTHTDVLKRYYIQKCFMHVMIQKKKLDQDNIKKKKKYFKSNKSKNFLVLPDHDARR